MYLQLKNCIHKRTRIIFLFIYILFPAFILMSESINIFQTKNVCKTKTNEISLSQMNGILLKILMKILFLQYERLELNLIKIHV